MSRVTRSTTRASRNIQAQSFPEHEEDQTTSGIPTTSKAQLRGPKRQASAAVRRTNKSTKGKQTTQSSQPSLGKSTQVPKENGKTAERKAPVIRAVAVPPNQDTGAAADKVSVAILFCRASLGRSTLTSSLARCHSILGKRSSNLRQFRVRGRYEF